MIPAVFLVPTNCSMVILKGPRHPKRTPMVCLKMMAFSNGSCGYCGIETSRSLVTGVCWVPSVIRHAHIDGGLGLGIVSFLSVTHWMISMIKGDFSQQKIWFKVLLRITTIFTALNRPSRLKMHDFIDMVKLRAVNSEILTPSLT